MGSALTGRDSNVLIYMNVNKPYYIAGEYVEGQIYLDVKTDRNYNSLKVWLEGQQHVYWSESHRQHNTRVTRVYTNTYRNYQSSFVVAQFNGILQAGQFLFPFSFLLPSMITGSFYISSFCYLKYTLRAQLVHPTSERQSQVYEMFLNILEPPRMKIGRTSLTNTVNSKCCQCCKDYGLTTVSLAAERNFVRSGDKIQVRGLIDNTRGKTKVKKAKVSLQQNLIKIAASRYNVNYTNQKDFPLHAVNIHTAPGQKQQFSFVAQIPSDITDCTAIGRVVARYFLLHLQTSYGCCANTSQAYLHLIVHSKTPTVVEKKKIDPPKNWNPKIFPKIVFENMKPYMYQPLIQIPFLNLPGNDNIQTNIRFNQQMNDVQGKNGYEVKDIIIKPNAEQYHYNPRFYGQNIFSQSQRIQQGYQPYFVNSNNSQTEMMNVKK